MSRTKSTNRVVRALVAVGTSVLTGAGAGAALARKPLLVTTDDRRGATMHRRAYTGRNGSLTC
jgi:hypothetical protein